MTLSFIVPDSLDTEMTFRWVSFSMPHEHLPTKLRVTTAESGHYSLIGERKDSIPKDIHTTH